MSNKNGRGPSIGVPLSRAITLDRTQTVSPSENTRERDDSLDSRASQRVSFCDNPLRPAQSSEHPSNQPTLTGSRWVGPGPETASPEDSRRDLEDEEELELDDGDVEDSSVDVSDLSRSGSDVDEDDEDLDSDEDDEDEDDEEDEEDDDDPPVSQYISALDLAGY